MKVSGKLHQKFFKENKAWPEGWSQCKDPKGRAGKGGNNICRCTSWNTVFLVPLAAFLVAVHRPSFRKEAGLLSLHLQPIACTSLAPGSTSCLFPKAGNNWTEGRKPAPLACAPLKIQAKEMAKTRKKPPKVGELLDWTSGMNFYP